MSSERRGDRLPRWLRWLRELVLLLLLVGAVGWWQARSLTRGPLPQGLRELSLPTLAGTTHSMWNPDHPTLLYVLAPWCGVCQASAGNINRLQNLGFETYSLALSWKNPEEVAAFIASSGLKTPVLLGRDSEGEALGLSSYPAYYMINRHGEIIAAWSGYTTTLGLFLRMSWYRLQI